MTIGVGGTSGRLLAFVSDFIHLLTFLIKA